MPSEGTIKRIVEFASRLEWVDTEALQDGLEIATLHRQIEQMTENDLAGWGLTARQLEIMEYLYHNAEGTMTPADLSTEVGLTRSAMTSALDSLENLGHAFRAPHPTDRRMIAISLTSSGREFIRERLPERYEKINRVVGCLSVNERAVLLQMYRKVLGLLVSMTGKGDGRKGVPPGASAKE
jgi:DNA-binding MarR family transcriptional regulator